MINKILSSIKFRFSEISIYARHLIYKDDTNLQKFVIFSQTRTGSHLLTDLLNSHPDIFCDGEIFVPYIKKDTTLKKVFFPNLYIEGMRKKNLNKIYGFNLKIYSRNSNPDEMKKPYGDVKLLVNKLHRERWKIIHIERLNKLRQAVSFFIAIEKNHWHNLVDHPANKSKVKINFEKLFDFIRSYKIKTDLEIKALSKIPHLKLIYENNLLNSKNHQKTADEVFKFLEVEPMPIQTKYRKISIDGLSDEIENYEEFIEVIEKTEYKKFLKIN